jgi:hypothetical protein
MNKICSKDILEKPAAMQSIDHIDQLAVDIIERSAALVNEKEKPVKKLALTELLKSLASLGLSYHASVRTQVWLLYF